MNNELREVVDRLRYVAENAKIIVGLVPFAGLTNVNLHQVTSGDLLKLCSAAEAGVQSPWIKTSERAPTGKDGNMIGEVLWLDSRKRHWVIPAQWDVKTKFSYWMPIPPLPVPVAEQAPVAQVKPKSELLAAIERLRGLHALGDKSQTAADILAVCKELEERIK